MMHLILAIDRIAKLDVKYLIAAKGVVFGGKTD